MPPWIGDHVAASRKDTAATNVRTATTVPETVEAMARPIIVIVGRNGVWQSCRFFLHARSLELPHPLTGKRVKIESPLPDDLRAVLAAHSLGPL